MFAVIYHAYLKPGKEAEYQEMWHKIAVYFKENRGALGSCLHKTDDGLWVAYSRWPSKEVRDASWPNDQNTISSELPGEILEAIKIVKDEPNADYTLNLKTRIATITANQTIKKGQEIFVSYGEDWFSSRNKKAKK